MRPWILPLLFLLPVVGCLGDAPAEAPATPGGPAAGPVATPISGEGASEGLVCAPVGCRVAEPSRDVPLPSGTPLRRVEATMTWTARDPSLGELEVFLLRITDEGWGWEESPDTYWRGPSPLAVTANVTGDQPQEHVLHARAVHQPAPGTEAGLSQAYRVEGTAWNAPS